MRNFAGLANSVTRWKSSWTRCADFLTHIISACHPKHLKGAVDKITLTDFSYWIKDVCLPIETLVHLNGNNLLTSNDFQYRLGANRLLLAMFKQYSNFMKVINQREQKKAGSNSLRKFKFDILNHLLMHFPTMEKILSSLEISIGTMNAKEVNVLEQLDVALDLILLLCQENQSFVNKTNTILNYLELLRPFYAGGKDGESQGNTKLEMKAIKTILWISPNTLDPQTEQFGSILTSFINAFVFGEREMAEEAGLLLRNIFKNTGIFDSGELEIDLWLESLRFIDKESVEMVTQVFIEVFQVSK